MNGIDHALRILRPVLALAPSTFLADIRLQLDAAGVVDAVARRDTAIIYGWMVPLIALQGIGDRAAFAFQRSRSPVRWSDLEAGLSSKPSCGRLACYWAFDGCGYRKAMRTCSEPTHTARCPLPRLPLRKGGLNQAAFALYLFLRDVCAGDFVGWVDARLAAVDPGINAPDRSANMCAALLDPLCHVHGIGPKLWSMISADLLLAADLGRERWVATGASMIAIDGLVHNFLVRTGILDRCGVRHTEGPGCYGPRGCAEVIVTISRRIDASEYNPTFPAIFPRFVQAAIWGFCAADRWSVCAGSQIDDRYACRQVLCPAYAACDRVALKPLAS